jgi:hypothetical protein
MRQVFGLLQPGGATKTMDASTSVNEPWLLRPGDLTVAVEKSFSGIPSGNGIKHSAPELPVLF